MQVVSEMDYFGMRSTHGQEWDQAFLARFSMHALASEHTHLTRQGNEYVGRCPFPDHRDSTPSFSVNEAKGVFRCFGCGRAGNAVSFMQQMYGLSHSDACRELYEGGDLPSTVSGTHRESDSEKTKWARNIWNDALPIVDTPVAEYLDSRALPFEFVGQQENIRFARLSFDRSAQKHPALVAAVRDLSGEIVGIQRIYLTEEGKKLGSSCKRSLGPTSGGAIRLRGIDAPPGEPENIYICEGLEDGLSIARDQAHAVVWVTMGTANLANVQLPPACKTVTIAHDNDDAGLQAADVATKRLIKAGFEVSLYPPPAGFKDWNEYLVWWEFSSDVYGNELEWLYVAEPGRDEPEVPELPSLSEMLGHDRF
ncbi:CHC2 zinc finger domain-containing protein [Sphingomonas sp. DG1-23]|uniref:CHC2 zinc finger domain-containing protein n=1 Tax=Sphingomonas sp. DG1-23 TaxID=3068316 RepID=UPI0027401002|nr:CHC2 zinc finger domain-containing protein [Sphingomonas sp. DG1-23]MDP5281410.1 CHC2 zinc finger domain-containing protein [Sphingomonas sp. DG1-23]